MGKTTYYQKEKRLDKLSKEQTLDLTFDLINAFGLVKNPSEVADLISNLFTADEIKDLAKRLRIAKLLLKGDSQRDISKSVHCSLATVTKINIWLQESKNGLKNIIDKLPKRQKMPENLAKIPIEFQAPQALLATAKYILAKNQKGKTEKFLEKVESKKLTDKTLKESVGESFRANKSKS
jgi:Trp operon repressor